VDESQVGGQVAQPGGELTAQRQLLYDAERRQADRRRRPGDADVVPHRQQKLLQITLRAHAVAAADSATFSIMSTALKS